MHGAVDLEVAVGHHQLALVQAGLDHIKLSGLGPEAHFASFKDSLPVRQPDIDHGALAGNQGSGLRNGKRQVRIRVLGVHVAQAFAADQRHFADTALAGIVRDFRGMHRADPFAGQHFGNHLSGIRHSGVNLTAHKHVRLQAAVFIAHIDPHLDSARLAGQHRIDKGNPPFECFPRVRLRREGHFLAVAQPLQVGFVRIELNPEFGQIGDGVNPRPGLDIHPLDCVLVNDNAAGRGVNGNMVRGRFGRFHLLDLLIGQSPKAQFFAGGFDRGLRGSAHDPKLTLIQVFGCLNGLDQLFLRR